MNIQSIADRQIHRPYIDGLRGLAILAVLGVHLPAGSGNFYFSGFNDVLAAGASGVQLFFLLSAFTLFRSSKSKYRREVSPRRNFYIRRFFRILPLWWISTLVYSFVTDRSLIESLPTIFMYFGFVRYDILNEVVPGGWSIFVEETFYLLLPLIFVSIASLRKAILFFAVLALVSIGWIKTAPLFGIPNTNFFISLFPIAQWPCLALGIIVYFFSEHEAFDRVFLQNIKLLRITELTAFILILFLYKSNFLAMSIPLALVFLVSISGRTLLGKITRLNLIRQFGVCCYSIYLFHIFLMGRMEPLRMWCLEALHLSGAPGEVLFLVWYPIFAGICLLFGFISFQFIERPCVNLGKKLIRGLEEKNLGEKIAAKSQI